MYMYFLFEKTQNNYIQTKTTIKQQQKIDAWRLELDAYDCCLEDNELAFLAPSTPPLIRYPHSLQVQRGVWLA